MLDTAARGKLAVAAALVQQVTETLDVSFIVCDCCGLTKYTDRTAWQQSIELEAITKKLRRIGAGGRR